MSEVLDYNKTYEILNEITNKIDSFKTNFSSKFKVKWEEFLNKNDKDPKNYSSLRMTDLTYLLIFGESKYNDNINKKVDYNKNKNLLKNVLFSMFGIEGCVEVISIVVKEFDDLLDEIYNKFEIVWSNETNCDNLITKGEINKLYEILTSMVWESTHVKSDLSTIKNLIYTAFNSEDINHLNKDTLKRYYFNDVYELKNNLRIFDPDKMIFGETNNIMRLFNKSFNYTFGDIICIYHTLNNSFKTLTNINKK